MANPKNRELVEDALKRELERDRTKTYVVEISPLGLVEMSPDVTDGPRLRLLRRLPDLCRDGIGFRTKAGHRSSEGPKPGAEPRSQAFRIELNRHVAAILKASRSRLDVSNGSRRRFVIATRTEPRITRGGRPRPAACAELKGTPVTKGRRSRRHLERDATRRRRLARVDKYLISVAGAANQVGNRWADRADHSTVSTVCSPILSSGRPVDPEPARALEAAGGDLAKPKTKAIERWGGGEKEPTPVTEIRGTPRRNVLRARNPRSRHHPMSRSAMIRPDYRARRGRRDVAPEAGA